MYDGMKTQEKISGKLYSISRTPTISN